MSKRSARLEIVAFAIAVTAMGVAIVVQAFRPADAGLKPRTTSNGARVTVTPNESARRVDITIGGAPFTSYVWPERLRKPVLYPIRSAKGTLVTRGWPLDPRPGERVDHPHHVGLWLNYESVNGVDFWNN